MTAAVILHLRLCFGSGTDLKQVNDDTSLYIWVNYSFNKQTNMDAERKTGRLKALNLQPVSQHGTVWPPSNSSHQAVISICFYSLDLRCCSISDSGLLSNPNRQDTGICYWLSCILTERSDRPLTLYCYQVF